MREKINLWEKMMEYNFTAYNAFIRYSPTNTQPQRDYNAHSTTSRNEEPTAPQQDEKPVSDKVTLSSKEDRQALIDQMTSQIGGANPLMSSLIPSGGLGMGTGLYSGVGQLASHQVKSLINGYV